MMKLVGLKIIYAGDKRLLLLFSGAIPKDFE